MSNKAKFKIGQIIHHRLFDYSGVVFDIDPIFQGSDEWYIKKNNKIRKKLTDLSNEKNFEPVFPPINLCSDNAAMIAWAGIERFRLGLTNKLDFPAKSRWPLDEKAPFLKGPGLKL